MWVKVREWADDRKIVVIAVGNRVDQIINVRKDVRVFSVIEQLVFDGRYCVYIWCEGTKRRTIVGFSFGIVGKLTDIEYLD